MVGTRHVKFYVTWITGVPAHHVWNAVVSVQVQMGHWCKALRL